MTADPSPDPTTTPTRRPALRRRSARAAAAALAAAACWTTAAPALAEPGPAPAVEVEVDLLSPLTAAACSSIPAGRSLAVTTAVKGVGTELGVSARVMLAGFEAGWVESHMNDLDCGDRDSLGVFQQRPSQGWGTAAQIGNPRYAARQFFVRAQAEAAACGSCSSGQIAQRVQRSAYPARYDSAASKARALLSEASGSYRGRTSIADVCGSGFRYVDAHELSGGTVYLLWNGSSNCVTTIKNARIGTRSPVRAYVDPQGPGYEADSGSFAHYAGPATLRAPGCIRWGGAVGSSSWDSPLGHCG